MNALAYLSPGGSAKADCGRNRLGVLGGERVFWYSITDGLGAVNNRLVNCET